MAEKYLSGIDLARTELLNAVLQNLATAPGSPQEGLFYYDTANNTFYGWNGTTWLDLGVSTILDNSVTNAKLSDMPTNTIKGRITVGTGDPEDLTPAQVRTMLNIEDGADVTDATNVNAAGAVMNSDTTTASMLFVIDEDDMVSDSDTKVPTQQSVKAYVDNELATALAGGVTLIGGYDASTNIPDLDTSPSGISKGDLYTVTAAGTFFSEDLQIGDQIIAIIDNPTVLADWIRVNKNIPDIVNASTTVRGIVELATEAETIAGTADRVVTADHLQTVLGNIDATTNKGYTDDIIGDDVTTAFVTTHNLASKDVSVVYYDTTTDKTVYVDTERTTINTVTSTFAVAPATGQDYRILINNIVDS